MNEQSTMVGEKIETWAFIEIYGHTKVAGRLTERKVGTEIMFQVDVPKGDTEFSHSELYGPKSIFSIKPTTEEWCRRWAKAAIGYGHEPLPYIPAQKQIDDGAQGDARNSGFGHQADDDEDDAGNSGFGHQADEDEDD